MSDLKSIAKHSFLLTLYVVFGILATLSGIAIIGIAVLLREFSAIYLFNLVFCGIMFEIIGREIVKLKGIEKK